jgi:hypothetical protein
MIGEVILAFIILVLLGLAGVTYVYIIMKRSIKREEERKKRDLLNIGVGAGEFKIIQSCNRFNTSGYLSLIIHKKQVVAQKRITDGELYNELFDLIVNKLGGRIDGR